MPRGDPLRALKQAVQDAQDQFRDILGPGTQRAVDSLLRLAGYRAGMLFVDVFLPKRFDPSYARGVLGYRARSRYEKGKRSLAERGRSMAGHGRVMPPQPRPFVLTGDSMRQCLASAQVEVRAYGSKGRMNIRIRCNPGAIAFTKQYANFTRIPEVERARVLREFNDQVDELLQQTGKNKTYTSDFRFTHERTIAQPPERKVGA